MNRRIVENPGTLRDLFYDSSWQLLEEDVSGSMTDQYVWSSVYIDALIERDTPTLRMYVQQNANFDVTSLVDTTGNVQERYISDPYGSFTILTPSWTSRGSSSYGWVVFHQGGRYDFATGLYAFRNRDYSPALGRWIENDPLGFKAGDNNYYRYLGNNPQNHTDPIGLDWFKCFADCIEQQSGSKVLLVASLPAGCRVPKKICMPGSPSTTSIWTKCPGMSLKTGMWVGRFGAGWILIEGAVSLGAILGCSIRCSTSWRIPLPSWWPFSPPSCP